MKGVLLFFHSLIYFQCVRHESHIAVHSNAVSQSRVSYENQDAEKHCIRADNSVENMAVHILFIYFRIQLFFKVNFHV